MTKGTCLSCKKEVEMVSPKESLTVRGVRIAKGSCPTCKKGVARILPKIK